MDDLLTTKQLQDLLQVDRITIYRMLNDGRLRGFKVGGQWRFSRQEIEHWLEGQRADLAATGPAAPSSPEPEQDRVSSQVLPLSCVQAIQGVCAEALDVAAVTTDPDGIPLTDISNSCDFCNLILSTAEGRRRCAISWKQLKNGQTHSCHAGLLCASASIEVKGQEVAITANCQFVTRSLHSQGQVWRANLSHLAADLGLTEEDLRAVAGSVYVVPDEYPNRVSRLLRRVADTFSEIGRERLNLLSRLQHIAEMSKV